MDPIKRRSVELIRSEFYVFPTEMLGFPERLEDIRVRIKIRHGFIPLSKSYLLNFIIENVAIDDNKPPLVSLLYHNRITVPRAQLLTFPLLLLLRRWILVKILHKIRVVNWDRL